jgi:2-deoxy-D-gluconate 3-dehydrogenase
MRPLEGQVVAITGANRGLGRQMCLDVAAAGASVVALGRSRTALEETILALGTDAVALSVECDLVDENSVHAAVATAAERFGRIDVLVNNAGVATERMAMKLPVEELRQTLDVNVVGTWTMTHAVGTLMAEAGGGKIINIASVMAFVSVPGLLAYGISKAAVVQMTRMLAVEWARYGVTVNCLAPGYFPTDINVERLQQEEVAARLLARIPLRRFGELEEIGRAVVQLASSTTDYMTGQVITLDGGMSVS